MHLSRPIRLPGHHHLAIVRHPLPLSCPPDRAPPAMRDFLDPRCLHTYRRPYQPIPRARPQFRSAWRIRESAPWRTSLSTYPYQDCKHLQPVHHPQFPLQRGRDHRRELVRDVAPADCSLVRCNSISESVGRKSLPCEERCRMDSLHFRRRPVDHQTPIFARHAIGH